MTTLDFNATNIQATDTLLDNLSQHGFSIVDDVYLPEYTHQLREECLHHLHQFRQAAIQNGIAKHIRSDHILWIDPTLPLAQQHIHALQDLSDQLNRAFFWASKMLKRILLATTQRNFMPYTVIILMAKTDV